MIDSQVLRHADTLKRLFAYLAEKSLSGEAETLKEYVVGVDIFGKSQNYDPQRDASVRIQCSKLRQKLEEYYLKEGANDPTRIEFPKGHFVLRFFRNEPRPVVAPSMRRWKFAALSLGAVWLATTAAWVGSSGRAPDSLTPELRMLWAPFLGKDPRVLICLGTPLFVRDARGFYRSPRVNRWEDAPVAEDLDWLRPEILAGRATPVHIYTGVGNAMGAAEVARLLTRGGTPFLMRRSSDVSWEDLAQYHIIFLGSPKYIPRIAEIPLTMDLVMEGRLIRNLRPRPGEPAVLEGNWPEESPHVLEDHALISRVPGLHGRARYLILSASSTEGTAAAAQFVTDPKFAAELVHRIAGGNEMLPDFFQAVIRARFKNMVPVEMTYLFHHELTVKPEPAGKK